MHRGAARRSLMAQSISITRVSQEPVQLGAAGNSQGKHLCLLSRETSLQHTTKSSSLGHLLFRYHGKEEYLTAHCAVVLGLVL